MLCTLSLQSLKSRRSRSCSDYFLGRRSEFPNLYPQAQNLELDRHYGSSQNANRNGVDWILVLKLVRYAHRTL